MEEEVKLTETLNKNEILNNILMVAELGMDIQQRCLAGEKYLSYLKSSFEKASRTMQNLHDISIKSMEKAKKLALLVLETSNQEDPTTLEFERIAEIIDKQLLETESNQTSDTSWNYETRRYSDVIKKHYEAPSTCSLKSIKSDVDEKYPENLSKESLIDLNNVINLPPVPEDTFTCFVGKPKRSSSLSSLKSIRKVKLFLQKAESSEEDDNSSETEEHDLTKLVCGDNEETKTGIHMQSKKILLGNIKEES